MAAMLPIVIVLWFGIMAGFHFAFSATVVPGLADADPLAALSAMRSINANVRNPVFGIAFWGAALLAVGGAAWAVVRRPPGWLLSLAASLAYLAGGFVVTLAGNAPLNDALALVDAADSLAATAMQMYLEDWGLLNDLRTAATALALLLAIFALRESARAEPPRA
jgi:uncharacterized membrane protein